MGKGIAYFLLNWAPSIVYVILYVVLDLLIANEGKENPQTGKKDYDYFPGVLILLAEVGKLIVTGSLLLMENIVRASKNKEKYNYGMIESEDDDDEEEEVIISLDWSRGIYYAVPAGLYTLWNFLNYMSLLHVPLSLYSIVYQVFSILPLFLFEKISDEVEQSVLFFSALLWSITFNKKLSFTQWFSLLLLAAGVLVVHVKSNFTFHFSLAIFWVLAQAMTSAVASVYNEFLYKRPSDNPRATSINVQNFYLYFFSSIFTCGYLIVSEDIEIFKTENFFRGFNLNVFLILCISVTLGLSVSLILKHRDLIVKLFAQAIHSPIEVISAHYALGTELTFFIIVASSLIGISTFLYYRPESQVVVVDDDFEEPTKYPPGLVYEDTFDVDWDSSEHQPRERKNLWSSYRDVY